jgi:hypothetical protein
VARANIVTKREGRRTEILKEAVMHADMVLLLYR